MPEGRAVRVTLVLLHLASALLLAGCGVGAATNEEKVSKTATTYLRALAEGDTAKACAQLTAQARGEECAQGMKERLSRFDPQALKEAADDSMDIDVEGSRATAVLSKPAGARFRLVKTGEEWRIDSGYTVG